MNFQDTLIKILIEELKPGTYRVEEAMDAFDKATLDAEYEAKRTGKPIKLPRWEDYAPKGKIQRVIDTSTPEGKVEADALKKSIRKKKKKRKKK